MRNVGFTGTRQGMTVGQLSSVAELLRRYDCLHHGDCEGADKQAHQIARESGMRVIGHPPLNPAIRAWCECDVLLDPKDYLSRNHDIVDAIAELIAAPAEDQERLRSGTWATIRYARKQRRMITIVYPDGTLEFCP